MVRELHSLTDSQVIDRMSQLKHDANWALLCEAIQENIDAVERQILDKTDLDGYELDDSGVDQLREHREHLKKLIRQPDEIIQQAKNRQAKDDNPELDPYYENAQEIEQDEKKKRSSKKK